MKTILDHVTLRTSDLGGTKTFLERLLDLKPGYRPAFPFAGYWLYHGDDPVVHLIPGGGTPVGRSSEYIDHVGFRIEDYDKTRQRLDLETVPYSTMDLAELHERRLFVHTPGGILLELVYRAPGA
jgi:catechol 2,3-dioxygenase-like lactoylglutathione lyase family enzyme